MSSAIFTDIHATRTQINRLQAAMSARKQALLEADTTIHTVEQVWQGAAHTAMQERYVDSRAILDEFSEWLEEYAALLMELADEFEGLDKEMERKIQALL